jgi:hypothetical protein
MILIIGIDAVHQLHPKFMLVADEEAISLMKELL